MRWDKAALCLLRISLGGIFLYFGIGKFRGDIWAETMKTMEFFQMLPWNVEVLVHTIGIIEVLTGGFLVLGVFTRMAAILAAGQLIGILLLLRFQEIRDIGLLAASLYLAVVSDGTANPCRFFGKQDKNESRL